MCLIDKGLCCFGCRMDILLCGLNFLVTIGCGATTVALSIIRLKDLKSSGARIASANHVKPTIASSGISGPGSCMSQLDDCSDMAYIGQIYTLSLYIFYALLDLVAACLIAFIYRNSDFLLDTTSRQVETTKRQKQRRYFHYWVALQFLLTLTLIFHAAFILATDDVNPAIGALIVLFICWKLFYFAIFARKLVHLELSERDNHTRNEDHERSVKKSKESAMTGRWVSEELRNSRANLNVNSDRDLDAKSKGKRKSARTGTTGDVERQEAPSSSSSSPPTAQIAAQAQVNIDHPGQDVTITVENANRSAGDHVENIDQQVEVEQQRKISNSSVPAPVPVNPPKVITAQNTVAQSAQKPQVVTVEVKIEDEKLPVPVLESLTQTSPADLDPVEAPASVAKVETEDSLGGEAQEDTMLNSVVVAAVTLATKTENAALKTVATEIETSEPMPQQQESSVFSVPENDFKIPAPQLNPAGESDLSLSSENTDEMPAPAETEINEKQNIEEQEKFIGSPELQNDFDDTETKVPVLSLDPGSKTGVPVPAPAPSIAAIETPVILSDIISPPSGFQTINDLPAPISA